MLFVFLIGALGLGLGLHHDPQSAGESGVPAAPSTPGPGYSMGLLLALTYSA